MADIRKTVEIIFGGKNEVSPVITDITRSFSELDTITSQIAAPLAAVGEGILKIDAALALLAIGGLALAVKESSEFNKSFALITTSIDATGKDLLQYRDDVLAYSTSSVKSIADINASLYTAAQAGIKYGDSLEFIRKAEELAVANNANLNTTVDLLTGTMNAYGFKMSDITHLNDVFFQSTLIGKQTIDELGQSMGQVVAIAANSGVSFEELSAAIATLTAKGMQTPDAITAVKNVIVSIISPSKEAASAAAALGLNFSLTELTSKGFAGILTEIMAKTGGSKEKMIELFNEVRAMNGALQLTGDGMKFFNTALEQTINSAGASEAAYKKMVETFSNQSQMVINTAKVAFISIGSIIEPMAAQIAGSFGQLFAGVKIAVDAGAFDPLFAYLGEVSTAISTWLAGVSAAFPEALQKIDFTKLIDAFRGLAGALGAYMGGFDLTQADDLAGALQVLVDILTGLVNITTGMAEAFRPFVSQIVSFFQELSQGGTQTQETIGKMAGLAMAFQNMGGLLFSVILAVDEFGVSMKGMFNIVAGGAQVIWNGFEILLTGIKGMLLILEGLFVSLLDKLTFGMFPGLKDLTADIAKQGAEIGTSFAKNGAEAAEGLARLGQGLTQLANESGKTGEAAAKLGQGLRDIPAKTELSIGMETAAAWAKLGTWKTAVEELPPEKDVVVDVVIYPEAQKKLADVKKPIDVELKFELARLKEQSDIVQKSLEWKAKVDIAQIEAASKQIEAAFKSVDNTVNSTGDTLTKLINSYAEALKSGSSGSVIIEQIEKENKRRDESLRLQKELTEATIENVKARTKALEGGQAMIQIDGSGLQPHLEAFMFEILSAIQIRANAEGAQLLVGI